MEVFYKGKQYGSRKECCLLNGRNPNKVYKRMSRGMTFEEAMEKEDGKGKRCKDFKGKEFNSQKEMCEHYEVSEATFLRRVEQGCDLKEALLGKKWKDHKGKAYKSKKNLCEAYGITTYAYDYRIKNGWSLKETLVGKESKKEM